MDVDDFFNDMMREENNKASQILSVVVKQQATISTLPPSSQRQQQQQSKLQQVTTNTTTTSTTTTTNKNEKQESNLPPLGEPTEVLQTLQRDINTLSNPTSDRFQKKASLEKIRNLLARCEHENRVDVTSRLYPSLLRPLLSLFSNEQVESVREGACDLMSRMWNVLSTSELSDTYADLVPSLHARLWNHKSSSSIDTLQQSLSVDSINLQPQHVQLQHVEKAEEIRLCLLKVLNSVVEKFGDKMGHSDFTEKIVQCLRSGYLDEFHEARKV